MAIGWDWTLLPGVLAGVVGYALAALIFWTRPDRLQNRLLALTLFLESTLAFTGGGIMYMASDPRATYGLQAVGLYALVVLNWSYLAFLGTLRTPLSRPFSTPMARRLLAAAALVSLGIAIVNPDAMITSIYPGTRWPWDAAMGQGVMLSMLLNVITMLYGLAVAISAFRRATAGTAERARTKAYAVAFGVRDGGLAVLWGPWVFGWAWAGDLQSVTWSGVVALAYNILLGYGILRTQLFDIDVKIKLALRKSTIAAIFIAMFFTISELGVAFFEDRTQSQVLGILSTGLLVFAIAPLQRVADRFSNAAMPGVRTDGSYLDAKKLEVYQAALEEALDEDGTITRTQTGYLARLRKRLDISDRDHALLHQALVNARRTGPSAPRHGPGNRVLGRYRIEDQLGRGAHGTTYLAHDEQLDRNVVLKALPAHGEDPERILREARATCQLNHPNIVTVYDIERVGDDVYIVMEHVDGGSLARRIDEGPLETAELARVADDLLAALEAVHERSGIHRDVKPANVLLTSKGRAKLADFGIASLPGHEITVELTGSEGAIGTVRYMSPEQAKGQLVDHRSDLYSAAVTLFEAYTGTPYVEPRKGESTIETQMRVARAGTFDQARIPDAPEHLCSWFARGLSPDAPGRFGSASEMREALEAP